MERGPVALFGAIVAVGLGPALWLGAQFGRFDAPPPRAPASVDQQHSDAAQLMGGSGAGDSETGADNDDPIRTTPRAHVIPLTTSPSASPSTSHTGPSASASAPDDPSGSGPSDEPSASPSQSTDPSGGGGGDNSPPPSPPADGGGNSGPGGGNGSGGTGGGNVGGVGD
jgi:hypothetical protein